MWQALMPCLEGAEGIVCKLFDVLHSTAGMHRGYVLVADVLSGGGEDRGGAKQQHVKSTGECRGCASRGRVYSEATL